jgi:hypothetical protein
MSWRFRKSFKVLPGLKLNLTRHGLSATLGAAPFSLNVGPRGVYSNVGIPGTGTWDRQRLDQPSPTRLGEPQPPAHGATPRPAPFPMPMLWLFSLSVLALRISMTSPDTRYASLSGLSLTGGSAAHTSSSPLACPMN